MPDETPEKDSLQYWHRSRSFSHGIVAIIPLLLLYEIGVVRKGFGQRSLLEVWISQALRHIDSTGLIAPQITIIALFIAIVATFWRSKTRKGLCPTALLLMVTESCFYALLLHHAGMYLTRLTVGNAPALAIGWSESSDYLLGIGAAVFEETVFRLTLIGGATLALTRMFRWKETPTCVAMVIISSILFSLVHHLGGEPFVMWVFVFRSICGALLGVFFLARGFGIAVWSHAIYNIMIIYQQHSLPSS